MCLFRAVNPLCEMDVDHSYDSGQPRMVPYRMKWKKEAQRLSFLVRSDNCAGQKKRYFCKTVCNAITLHGSMPADCLRKVVHKTNEILYHKMKLEPQIAPKVTLSPIYTWKTPQWKCSGIRKAAHIFQRVPWFNLHMEDAAVEVQWHGKSSSHFPKGSLLQFTLGGRRSGSAVAWEKLLTYFKGFLASIYTWRTPQWKCSGMGKGAHIFQRVPCFNLHLEDAAVEVQWHGKKVLTYFKGFPGLSPFL